MIVVLCFVQKAENSLRTGDVQYDLSKDTHIYMLKDRRRITGTTQLQGISALHFAFFISSLSSSLLYMESTFRKVFYDFKLFAGNFRSLSVSDRNYW